MQQRAQDAHYARHFPHARHDVITVDGARAGRLLLDDEEDAVRIVDISLLPAYRGRGIGSALIGALQRDAAAMGREVRLSVVRGARAEALYRRLGFRDADGDAVHASMCWRSA